MCLSLFGWVFISLFFMASLLLVLSSVFFFFSFSCVVVLVIVLRVGGIVFVFVCVDSMVVAIVSLLVRWC